MEECFKVLPWIALPFCAEGFDMGCGSGHWANLIAPRVGKLCCIDPSEAIEVSERALGEFDNFLFMGPRSTHLAFH